jgi:hypothetical protein
VRAGYVAAHNEFVGLLNFLFYPASGSLTGHIDRVTRLATIPPNRTLEFFRARCRDSH